MINIVFFLEGNPFLDAYFESDFLGRAIFLLLALLSILSWSLLIHKVWILYKVKEDSFRFQRSFLQTKETPLAVQFTHMRNRDCPNAFFLVYEVIKTKTFELLQKNGKQKGSSQPQTKLFSDDIALLETHASSTISSLTQYLEKNLYLLSTIVTLAPFLGLLGTVYGILVTFTGLQESSHADTNQIILGGISLALTTTVLGLVDAVPALIGYNYLKNAISEFDMQMENFAVDVLSSIETTWRISSDV